MTVALRRDWRSLRARRGLTLLIMLVLAGATLLAAPLTSARAYQYKYFDGVLAPGQQTAGPTYPSIANSYAADYGVGPAWVATGAHVPGSWAQYGSYVTGYGSACHSYAPGNALGGLASNAELYTSLPMAASVDTTAPC
jgi:hypothetical protein